MGDHQILHSGFLGQEGDLFGSIIGGHEQGLGAIFADDPDELFQMSCRRGDSGLGFDIADELGSRNRRPDIQKIYDREGIFSPPRIFFPIPSVLRPAGFGKKPVG